MYSYRYSYRCSYRYSYRYLYYAGKTTKEASGQPVNRYLVLLLGYLMMREGSAMLGPELRVRSSRVILSRSGRGKEHGTCDR